MSLALKKIPDCEYTIFNKGDFKEREEVYKLWYQVYCLEMKRNLNYANHSTQTIRDDLESFSYLFVAKYGGTTVGSFRINFPDEGNSSYYIELYNLKNVDPKEWAIGTRYMVHSDYRGNYISFALMEMAVHFLKTQKRKNLVIDCSPPVYQLFEKLGFRDYLGEKNSIEYGKVKIMRHLIK